MFNASEFTAKVRNSPVATVERAADNSGTYVIFNHNEMAEFVPNSTRFNGEWLYYSGNVVDEMIKINPNITIHGGPFGR